MEFYLDTANTKIVKKLYRVFPIHGVTTNPSIIAKENRPLLEVLIELQDILGEDGSLFAQVIARDSNRMIDEALKLREKIPSLIIKIPVISEGLIAIKELTKLNVPTLGTAVYSPMQGLLSALSGAKYVAPYVNRIDNQGNDGIKTVAELQSLVELHTPQSTLLAASFRTPRQVLDCLLTGCHSVTIHPDIVELFLSNPAVFEALDKFDIDWENAFGSKNIECKKI